MIKIFDMKKQLLILVFIAGLFSSCIQENFDNPPSNGVDPDMTATITIAQLKSLYTGVALELDDSMIISGIVVADDKSGNLYKSIIIDDGTAGILIRLENNGLFGAYPVGRRLFIKLGGLWMGDYGGLIQLGGQLSAGTTNEVDVIPAGLFDTYIFKGTINNPVVPLDVDIPSLNDSYQNRLIRLQNVQFIYADTGKTFADVILQQTVNLNLTDCNGNQLLVRTSGYADFAGQIVPGGNGEFVCIYGIFNSDQQLTVRHPADLKLTGARCGDPIIYKDFEDGAVTSGGWTVQQPIGPSVTWSVNTTGATFGNVYGQCKNYLPPNVACETWLISPSMDLTSFASSIQNPIFSMESACNYTGADIAVYYSTDYVSGLPATGTWNPLPVAISAGSWAWTNSGNIDLSTYTTGNNVHIGIKYTGTNSDGKTWEIDEIKVVSQ
jgi:hypothetical protein